MSFYGYPFHRRAQGFPPAHHTSPAAHPHHEQNFHFYPNPPAYPTYDAPVDDYEAEERAALAHLRAIQQRRQAAQVAAEREAAIRASIQARREAEIRAAIEREQAKEFAIRQAIAKQVELERRRQEEIERVNAERLNAIRHAQQAKRAEFERYHAQVQARQAQAAAAHHRAQVEQQLKRDACARRCAGGCAKKAPKEDDKPEVNDIANLLSTMFGFNFDQLVNEAEKAEALTPSAPVEEKKESQEKEVSLNENTTTPDADNKQFPNEINNLLSQFFGLQVEPAKDGDKPASGSNPKEFTENLNKFLGQFGLEFEPDVVESKESAPVASSSSAPAPAPAPTPAAESSARQNQATDSTPITCYLDNVADIPPFVRDILSNVEQAFKEGNKRSEVEEKPVEGKGKGVAEGEKKVTPTPVPAPTPAPATIPSEPVDDTTSTPDSIDKLKDIAHELHLATESFSFPSNLSFASPSTPSEESTPALLFNKANSGYHAQAHKLLQLLLAADGVSSGGDRDVRKLRKSIVKDVEGAIETLERKRDEIWKEVKERRERGEESDDETSTSSCGSSVIGDHEPEHEHIEHAEVVDEVKPIDTTADQPQSTESHDEPQGFEVPEPASQVSEKSEEDVKEVVDSETKVEVNDLESKAEVKKDDREEGYELL
jgi:hypothetical protein